MYHRTQNDNGSYNSRCLDCFMTIASCVETEKELEQREAHHLCPEKVLAQLLAQGRAAAAQAARN
jgi:ABC-type Fe3+-citrate transport system substrate-binding protein